MAYFFTADLHFNHDVLRKLLRRPFATSKEMNAALIDNWNSEIGPDDSVYVLGDFGTGRNISNIFGELNGKKHLVVGNHDTPSVKSLEWEWVRETADIVIEGQQIFLAHLPHRIWCGMGNGNVWHLYGHVHGQARDHWMSFDVGVDAWKFYPISFHAISIKMSELSSKINRWIMLNFNSRCYERKSYIS